MSNTKIFGANHGIATSNVIPDNNSTALEIEGVDAKDYIVIDTTDSNEKMTLKAGGSSSQEVVIDKNGNLSGAATSHFKLFARGATATQPTVVPYADRTTTGLGSSGADALSLIAGAVEGIRITEASNATTTQINGKALVKGDLSDALQGTLSVSSGNNAVTGSGTAFLTEIFEGSAIKLGSEIHSVAAVASNTALTLDANAAGAHSGITAYTDNSPVFQVQSGDSRSLLEANNGYVRINGRGGPSDDSPQSSEVALYIDGGKPVTGNTDSCALEINAVGSNGAQILLSAEGNYMGRFMAQSNKLYLGTQYASQDVVLYPGSRNIMTIRGDDYAAVLQDSDIKLYQNEASAAGQEICFYKSRNTTDENATTAVNDNDILGEIKWKGADGNSFATGAQIFARVRGTVGDGDMPCELVFAMSKDGSEAPVETLRIMPTATANKAQVTIGTDSYASAYTYSPIAVDAETQNGPVFERTNNGNAMVFQFNTKNCIAGSNHPISLMPGGTERLLIGTDGTVTATSGLLSSVGAVATALTDSGGTASVSTSGSSTTLTGVNTAFTTDFHVGAAIKVGTVTTTVTQINSATELILEDAINTSSTGTTCTRDGGELFAVKTGDSKTIFSVNSTGAVGLGTATGTVAKSNLSIGDANAFDNTTHEAFKNTFVGQTENAHALTGGHSNTLFGFAAGEDLANGDRNTSIGCESGGMTNSTDSTYVGYRASQNGTGSNNVGIGASAMLNFSGADSVGIGKEALDATNSLYATSVGYQSLTGLTATTQHNTALGYRAGMGVDDGNQCVFLGSTADTTDVDGDNQISIGYGAVCDAPNTMVLGNSSLVLVRPGVNGTVELGNGSYEWDDVFTESLTESSDARVKENVENTALGLDFINRLRPVSYRLKDTPREVKTVIHTEENTYINEDGEEVIETTTREEEVVVHPGSTHARKHEGLIAQEVKSVLDDIGIDAADFGGYVDANISGGADKLALRYREFIGPLIKAVQELTARIATLEGGD